MPHFNYAALLLFVPAAFGLQDSSADDRFVAWLADGTKLTAPALSAWPLPVAPFRFANHDLLAPAKSVRLMHDRQQSLTLKAPYIVLANGDVLPGMPVQLEPTPGQLARTPRVRVSPERPILPVTGTSVAVRTERVARLVLSPDAAAIAPPEGTVVLADGRRLAARSIRWREGGLAILTGENVVEATFTELADIVFPNVDVTEAVLEDNLWAGGGSAIAIARFQATNGAVVTAARASREPEQDRRRGRVTNGIVYYLQPAWADQPLALPEQEIVCCGYRAGDEAPLTAFGATAIANRRLIGNPAPWSVNRSAAGNLLAASNRQSDLGIAAHSHSAIAIDLPPQAQALELAVGLDRVVGDGGCVRCKVIGGSADGGQVLWDSGVIQGKDGVQDSGRLSVADFSRLQLVTEFAHEDRPAGADPLDIRDSVVWLSPLVRLDASIEDAARRALAVLPGAAQWKLAGDGWKSVQLASRWNVPANNWDSVLAVSQQSPLTLTHTLPVTRANDVVELLTVCPVDLDEHDFTLSVNGEVVGWHNNADRNQLRQWTLRHSRTRAQGGDEEANLTDRLAYWWDLSRWRGEQVQLQLTIQGKKVRNEIAWRELSIRSAIGNLPAGQEPRRPDLPLLSLEALPPQQGDGAKALKDGTAGGMQREPIRFLGQEFSGGIALARDSRVRFSLQPKYQKFVAIVGCSAQVAGPVQIAIDDRVVWERATINSLSPAEQIAIEIPAGSNTLTLRSGADGLYYGQAAFAEAGFIVK